MPSPVAFARTESRTLTNFYFDPDPAPQPTLVGFNGETHTSSLSLVAPVAPEETALLRRALMPLGPFFNRILRTIWQWSPKSRSTWFDSRLWRTVWNTNRFFSCTPSRRSTARVVRFSRQIVVDLDLSRLTDVLAFCYGPGEIEVGHACASTTPHDGVVADVGGNVGTTALSFAAIVPAGRVHVFEPSPDMLPHLRRNLALSGASNVTVHPIGLSDAPTRGRLRTAIEGNPGSAHFVTDGSNAGHDVEVARLDDLWRDRPRLDFVKIDVEGLEAKVIAGAHATLQRCRPVVLFEVNESALGRAGSSGAEVCNLLTALGYRLTWLQNGVFRDYATAGGRRSKLHNVIAFPAERAPAVIA